MVCGSRQGTLAGTRAGRIEQFHGEDVTLSRNLRVGSDAEARAVTDAGPVSRSGRGFRYEILRLISVIMRGTVKRLSRFLRRGRRLCHQPFSIAHELLTAWAKTACHDIGSAADEFFCLFCR